MTKLTNFKRTLILLSTSFIATTSFAQVFYGQYDFMVRGTGMGMTRDVALNYAVTDGKRNCERDGGSGSLMVGYGNPIYTNGYGSVTVNIDVYCKRGRHASLDEDVSASKNTPAPAIQRKTVEEVLKETRAAF